MFRELLVRVCEQIGEVRDIAATGRADTAIRLCRERDPDLLILDLQLEEAADGFEVIEAIREQGSAPKIVVLTAFTDDYTLTRAHRARVDAFLQKEVHTHHDLLAAIGAIRLGRRYRNTVLEEFHQRKREDPFAPSKILGERDERILRLYGLGLSDHDVGERLGVSARTACNNRLRVMGLLQLPDFKSLVLYALRNGYARVKQRLSR